MFAHKLIAASCIALIGVLGASGVKAQEPKTFKDCEICPEMAVVPAGNVMLGSYETEAYRRKGERGKQKAKIKKPFAMAKTEITLRQFRQFVTETGYQGEVMVFRGETYEGCNFLMAKATATSKIIIGTMSVLRNERTSLFCA